MPRLSEPMREALRMAVDGQGLSRSRDGWWRSAFTPTKYRVADNRTVTALDNRGLLCRDGLHYVITPAGREAIGMKEGEDNV